jgi:hypothetical protein
MAAGQIAAAPHKTRAIVAINHDAWAFASRYGPL